MLSTTPLDPYSIAKSLIFIVTVNPKIHHPPCLTELADTPDLSALLPSTDLMGAFESGPVWESYASVPQSFTGNLVRAEQHPLEGISVGGAGPSNDDATTESELEACIGCCDTAHRSMRRRMQMLSAAEAQAPSRPCCL